MAINGAENKNIELSGDDARRLIRLLNRLLKNRAIATDEKLKIKQEIDRLNYELKTSTNCTASLSQKVSWWLLDLFSRVIANPEFIKAVWSYFGNGQHKS